MLVVYGYKTAYHDKKFLGNSPCEVCGKFTEHYLSRAAFQITIYYLPIFGFPTSRHIRCKNCGAVSGKLTKDQWKQLKDENRDMPKRKDYRSAYETLKAVVSQTQPENLSTDAVYSALLGKISVSDDAGFIKKMTDSYMENSAMVDYIKKIPELNAAAAAASSVPASEATLTADDGLQTVSADAEANQTATYNPAASADASAAASAPVVPVTDYDAIIRKTPYISPAETIAAQKAAKEQEAADKGLVPRSKARFLWLLLALPMTFVSLFALLCVFIGGEGDVGITIFFIVAFLLCTLLTVLFYILSFKKYKKNKTK